MRIRHKSAKEHRYKERNRKKTEQNDLYEEEKQDVLHDAHAHRQKQHQQEETHSPGVLAEDGQHQAHGRRRVGVVRARVIKVVISWRAIRVILTIPLQYIKIIRVLRVHRQRNTLSLLLLSFSPSVSLVVEVQDVGVLRGIIRGVRMIRVPIQGLLVVQQG